MSIDIGGNVRCDKKAIRKFLKYWKEKKKNQNNMFS